MNDAEKLQQFIQSLSNAITRHEAMQALAELAQSTIGAKLLTVTTVDMRRGLARRAYSNLPDSYPVSGTKPIKQDDWFAHVNGQKQIFVANSLSDIANVFPDYDIIDRIGCGSVINLPIFIKGDLAATLNLLHEEGFYTSERIVRAQEILALPAISTMLSWINLTAAV